MNFLRVLNIAIVALGLSGCATYSNGLSQSIDIRTSGVDNVTCKISNNKYKYEVIAPAKVSVERDSDSLNILCRRAGYLDVHETIEPVNNLGKAVLGNLYNGIIPGLAYDMVAGSSYAYPDLVIIDMRRDHERYIVERTASYVLPKKEYYDFEVAYNKPSDLIVSRDAEYNQDAARAIRNSIVK